MYDEQKRVLDSIQDAKEDIEKSAGILQSSFSNIISGEFVRITISKKPIDAMRGGNVRAGVFTFHVMITEPVAPVEQKRPPKFTGNFDAVPGSYGFSLIQQLQEQNYTLREAALKEQHARELEGINKRLDELSKPAEMSKADKYLDLLMIKLLKQIDGAEPVAGITEQPEPKKEPATEPINGTRHEETTGDAKKRLTGVLQRLAKADKNFLTNLEKVAAFAEKQPELFQEYLKNL